MWVHIFKIKNWILCWLFLLWNPVSNLILALYFCPIISSPSDIIQLNDHFYMDCSQLFGHELRPSLYSSSRIFGCFSNTTKQTCSKPDSFFSSTKPVLPPNFPASINGATVLLGKAVNHHWPLPLFIFPCYSFINSIERFSKTHFQCIIPIHPPQHFTPFILPSL